MNYDNLGKVRAYQLSHPTMHETVFSKKLSAWGFKFQRQRILVGYIPDFFLPQFGLVIEIDGIGHSTYGLRRDQRRDATLREAGYHVHRIPNPEVYDYQKEDLLQVINGFDYKPPQDKTFFYTYLKSLRRAIH